MYGTIWALFGQDMFQWNGMMIGLSLGAFGLFHAGAQALTGLGGGPAGRALGDDCHGVRTTALLIPGRRRRLDPVRAGAAVCARHRYAGTAVAYHAAGRCGQPGQASGGAGEPSSASRRCLVRCSSRRCTLPSNRLPGLIWIVGGAVYLLALPLLLGIRRTRAATVTPDG